MDLNGIERFSCTSKLYESMETDGCSQYFNEGRRPIVCNFQEHAQNGLSIGGTLVSRCPTTIEETFFKKISTVDVCLSTKEIVVRFILVKKKLFCFFFFSLSYISRHSEDLYEDIYRYVQNAIRKKISRATIPRM